MISYLSPIKSGSVGAKDAPTHKIARQEVAWHSHELISGAYIGTAYSLLWFYIKILNLLKFSNIIYLRTVIKDCLVFNIIKTR